MARKTADREGWARIRVRSLALISKAVARWEKEERRAAQEEKKSKRIVHPKIDLDRLIKVADAASRFSLGEKVPDDAPTSQAFEQAVADAVSKVYGEQAEKTDASAQP